MKVIALLAATLFLACGPNYDGLDDCGPNHEYDLDSFEVEIDIVDREGLFWEGISRNSAYEFSDPNTEYVDGVEYSDEEFFWRDSPFIVAVLDQESGNFKLQYGFGLTQQVTYKIVEKRRLNNKEFDEFLDSRLIQR